jgi:hypothetical protein
MEQNATQGQSENPLGHAIESPAGVPPSEPQKLLAETAGPDGLTPTGQTRKKTTIQLFTSTTDRLTSRKRGRDTYDDVINRDLDTIKKSEKGG